MKTIGFKHILLAMTAMLSGVCTAESQYVSFDASGCRPGVWTSDFKAAKDYADKNHYPLLSFWGSDGCGYCKLMQKTGLANGKTPKYKCEKLAAWLAKKPIVLVFTEVNENYTQDKYDTTGVKKFTKGTNTSGLFPYMRIYWPKADGSVAGACFSGRKDKMPSKVAGTLEEQLVASLDMYLASWTPVPPTPPPPPYAGGDFLVPGTAQARLEAVAGETASVVVPLVRNSNTDKTAQNVLMVGSASQTIDWAAGESRKDVTVDTSKITVGESIALTLKYENAVHSISAIYGVAAPANSPMNPAWGDEDFTFGQWTMNLDAAKRKTAAASGEAYTLVFFTGALWCPWCLGLENYVFDTEEFRNWAAQNQVSLVLLDNLKRSANDSASAAPFAVSTVANGAAPSLLSYDVGANGASGAAYMSRKGITASASADQLQKNHDLGYLGGTYCAPGSLRTGYPTLLLLDKGGMVKGCFVAQYNSTTAKDANGAYPCDKNENLQRLKDFIKLATDDCVLENDKYVSTTTLVHSFGTVSDTELSVCENANVFKLQDVAGKKVQFSVVTDTAARGVTFTILKKVSRSVAKKDASATTTATETVVTGEMVVSGEGTLTYAFPATGEYYLQVSEFADAQTAKYGTVATASKIVFMSELSPDPIENPYLKTAFSNRTVPVYSGSTLVGTLLVTAKKTGKVSLKYTSAVSGRKSSITAAWGDADFYGTATATGTARATKVTVVAKLNADGTIEAEVTDPAVGAATLSSGKSSILGTYEKFMGYYTVALMPQNSDKAEDANFGTGYMTIKATTSATKSTGKVSCKVFCPDGKSLSATGYLEMRDDGWAGLSLVKSGSKDSVRIAVRIRPNAAAAVTRRAVVSLDDVKSIWTHSQPGFSFTRELKAYGSYYSSGESLIDCCGGDTLTVDFDTSLFSASERYGAISSVLASGTQIVLTSSRLSPAQRITGFKASVTKSTGIVKGSTKAIFESGRKVSVKYVGIVLPDWSDCGCHESDAAVPLTADLPFVIGTCYYNDRVGGKLAPRGFMFEFADGE